MKSKAAGSKREKKGQNRQKIDAKRVTQVGMLCAVAYLLMALIKIPVVLFLQYEPKDVVITLGGFLFGPMTSFVMACIVAVVEMVTVSDTGVIGCVMNILAASSFACTASYFYKREHSRRGAVRGLLAGGALMTTVMLLWNYLVTPLYMGYPREMVAAMLVPAFLPYNLLKAGLNGAILLLIYKPVVTALRRAGLIAPAEAGVREQKEGGAGRMLPAALAAATCVLIILAMQGII